MITQHERLDTAIQKVGNRYVATMLIAKRIRQLYHGARAHVERQEGESYFSVAVREIAEGLVTLEAGPASSASGDNGTVDHNGSSDDPPAPAGKTSQA